MSDLVEAWSLITRTKNGKVLRCHDFVMLSLGEGVKVCDSEADVSP